MNDKTKKIIEEEFYERFENPENTGYRVGQEFLGAVREFLFSTIEKLLSDKIEAVEKLVDNEIKILGNADTVKRAKELLGWGRGRELIWEKVQGLEFAREEIIKILKN